MSAPRGTPLTDALFDKHVSEARSTDMDNMSMFALSQVGELLEHAKRMERERAELVGALTGVMRDLNCEIDYERGLIVNHLLARIEKEK